VINSHFESNAKENIMAKKKFNANEEMANWMRIIPKIKLSNEKKRPKEYYEEYGQDLDGCRTQENEGCGRCPLFK
jgi:hypothetical protein